MGSPLVTPTDELFGGESTDNLPSPRRPGLVHRTGLLLVALGITAFAILYAAAVMALAAAVAWLLTEGDALAALVPFPPAALALQVLLLCGLLLGIFLLTKGLWRIERRRNLAVPVDPAREPDLVAFVEHLCGIVGAPAPSRITLNCGPDVSVEFDSFPGFLRNRPVLRLGLSAVTVSSSGQLAALLAGELSRYAHRTGSRRASFVATANRFLARATAGDDSVDRWLARQAGSGRLAPLARGLLEVSHRARCESRWLQRQVARISQGALARRLEFSQECAAYAGGALTAERVPARRSALRSAAVRATAAARQSWTRDGRLPEDLTLQTARFFTEIRPRDHVHETAAMACETPAGVLFRDFYRLARKLTLLHYRIQLRLPVTGDRLGDDPAGPGTAVDNFFFGCFAPLIPLGLRGPAARAPDNARDTARKHADKMLEVMRSYRESDRELLGALQAEALLEANIPIDPNLFGLNASAGLNEVHERCRYLEGRLEWFSDRLAGFQRLVAARLREAVEQETGSDPHSAERRMLEVLVRTDRLLPTVSELRTHLLLLEVLLAESLEAPRPALNDRISEHSADVLRLLKGIRIALRNIPYPVGNTLRNGLHRHVMRRAPDENLTAAERLELGQDVVERLLSVRRAALQRLAVLATRMESTKSPEV
ncbi:M48 family metallopeptidase [Thiohalomonas denitrificans]|uniref:Zn-dependent protease with chaperone function n=1 Tax=Thiohalomonas denitrificans TaxID=415747 RepID=A0A1G5PUP2_9GAMM|nr:M48 family metallopeptidase [Thiohalomonas denitrificans]SCZ53128.1 hypothetical protein SAMN03097708_00872 [Thiohalomonas denitrificans]